MPMIRDTPPPLPVDVVRDLRAALPANFGHRLVEHEGKLVLVVHVPSDVPDRELDRERMADVVLEDEVALARDILLIGSEKLIRLDPIPVRDLVRERLRDDQPVAKEVRKALPREHGSAVFRPSTRREVAIAVRVPHGSYRETSPEDLAALQTSLAPILAKPEAARAELCYLVADNDYHRCRPEEFGRILRAEVALRPPKVKTYAVAGEGKAARSMANASMSGSPFGMLMTAAAHTDQKMETLKQRKTAPPPAQAAAEVSLAPATTPAQAPPSPSLSAMFTAPPAPTPLLAPPMPAPVPPAPAPAPTGDVLGHLGGQFTQLGYEVRTDVGELGLAFAAHKDGGKRIIVQQAGEATLDAVQALAKAVQELEADVALLIAKKVAPGAWLEAAGSKVEVLPEDAVDEWRL